MLLAVDFGVLLGGAGSLVAAVVAAIALFQNRRTEHKTATREEVQQAFDMQDRAMSELDASNVRLTATLAATFAEMADLKEQHSKCQKDLKHLESRLHIAEAKIAELGG